MEAATVEIENEEIAQNPTFEEAARLSLAMCNLIGVVAEPKDSKTRCDKLLKPSSYDSYEDYIITLTCASDLITLRAKEPEVEEARLKGVLRIIFGEQNAIVRSSIDGFTDERNSSGRRLLLKTIKEENIKGVVEAEGDAQRLTMAESIGRFIKSRGEMLPRNARTEEEFQLLHRSLALVKAKKVELGFRDVCDDETYHRILTILEAAIQTYILEDMDGLIDDRYQLYSAITDVIQRPGWQQRALCKGVGSLMFPNNKLEVDEALKACNRCPVREDCLEYALSLNLEHGVWGGTSERERRRIKRQRKLEAKKRASVERSVS